MAISSLLSYLLVAVYFFFVISCIIVVLSENRNPIRSLAWVIALVFLPFVGIVFYQFLGRNPKMQHIISRHYKRRIANATRPENPDTSPLGLSKEFEQLARLAANISISPLTMNNELEIFSDGATKFEALEEDLRAAKSSIYLQYYIFSDDTLGQEIADILMERARAGVVVKVIYDHVGSFSARNRFFKRLRAAGVDAHPFFKVTFHHLASRINWRNHRKIVVIDGKVGYIGGMNIAQRYVFGTGDGRVWRDTHFRVRGEIVKSLIASFAIDWSFTNKPFEHPRQPDDAQPPKLSSHIGMQLICSGPTERWANLSLCFLSAITAAQKHIYIQTPYFLPTEALLQALQAAALAKVDVRIMIPGVSDSRLIRYASFSYITQCLQAGIKVYLYKPGMLHAKTMIIDDDFCTSGSTNFDFRSLENNFESNLLIYSHEANQAMQRIFFEDQKQCVKISLSQWHRRPLSQRFLESTVRLLSPIL